MTLSYRVLFFMVSTIIKRRSVSAVDDSLSSWQEIKHHFQDGGILLGNGFSQAVWKKFGYSSIYETSCLPEKIPHPISAKDKKLFSSANTSNFERVLSYLSITSRTTDIFDGDISPFEESYERIKTALGEAIQSVHVPRDLMTDEVLTAIRTELRNYRHVYSTNYDLLPYWSIMAEHSNGGDFKDFFWQRDESRALVFDMTDTSIWKHSATRIYYLHGALHLYRDPWTGRTHKLVNGDEGNLLDKVELPLFISEGSSEDKQQAIRESDYLTFAYQSFLQHEGPLVIFGHSLDDSDKHLVQAISRQSPNKIAVSIRGTHSSGAILEKKARLKNALRKVNRYDRQPELLFFDSGTHPLGSPDLEIPESSSLHIPNWHDIDLSDIPF